MSDPKAKLTTRQRLFVEHYLGPAGGNATEAARLAGYASPGQEGHRLLKNAEIAAAIEGRVAAVAMETTEILGRLADIARGGDFWRVDSEGEVYFDFAACKRAGKLHILKGMKLTRYGPQIEFEDAQAALVTLGRHFGLWVDKQDVTSGGEPFKVLIGINPDEV